VETALHQLVVRVEKALDQQEIAVGVFLDIEGAFNNTSYDSMCEDLVRHGVDHTIVRWVKATLEGRQATATLGSISRVLLYPENARREVCCRLSYGALLLMNFGKGVWGRSVCQRIRG